MLERWKIPYFVGGSGECLLVGLGGAVGSYLKGIDVGT